MSFPFTKMPQFGEYLSWVQQLGFEVRSINTVLQNGEQQNMTRIVAPSGKKVFQAIDQREVLSPYLVQYLDRRLGVQSPWLAIPECES